MFEFGGEYEPLINIVFLIVTAGVAWHGIRFRDAEGNTDFIRLLFGCIAAVFFFHGPVSGRLGRREIRLIAWRGCRSIRSRSLSAQCL